MKVSIAKTATFAIALSFAATGAAIANPNQTQVLSKHSPAQSSQQSSKAKRPPMANYWDARAWDSEGGTNFWHATEESKRGQKKQLTGRSTKGSGLVKKIFGKKAW